jgi:hypothetical protein
MRKDPLKGARSIRAVSIALECGDLMAAGHYQRGIQIVQKEMERLLRIDRTPLPPAEREKIADEIRQGDMLLEKLQACLARKI